MKKLFSQITSKSYWRVVGIGGVLLLLTAAYYSKKVHEAIFANTVTILEAIFTGLAIFILFILISVDDKKDWLPAIPFAIFVVLQFLIFFSIFDGSGLGVGLFCISTLVLWLIYWYLRLRTEE